MDDLSKDSAAPPAKLLLHACCGPCSLEPVRLLRERGIEPKIHYANPNIEPQDEYERRLGTIRQWCDDEGLELVEDDYDRSAWEATAGAIGDRMDARGDDGAHRDEAAEDRPCDEAAEDEPREATIDGGRRDAAAEGALAPLEGMRRARCRACYRTRFERSAEYAAENGYDALGTTLSVSPYQYADIIEEELRRACERAGIRCLFEDYSPHYPEATRRSRELGMYRQSYCGCRFSEAEAEAEREERRRERERRRRERAAARHEEEAALEERRRKRAEHEERRARRSAILRSMRMARKAEEGATDPERKGR